MEGLTSELETSHVLLVKLDPTGGELEMGLSLSAAVMSDASRPGQAIGFHTQQADPGALLSRIQEARLRASRGHEGAEVPAELLASRCFVVLLRKRPESKTVLAERITVGRARTHDVVLRHHTVSKFHAYFDQDPSGELRIADAGSTNHTHVNDVVITNQLVPIKPGARIRFGSVETVYCSLSGLVEALARQ